MRFDLWGSITYGQNLEPQISYAAYFAAICFRDHCFYQDGLISVARQGWMSQAGDILCGGLWKMYGRESE
jgi:hypothetical protein